MNKVLVTGGAGFIGAHVAKVLAERGDTVTVFDDFNDRYSPRLKEERFNHLLGDKKNVELVRGSITDKEALKNLFDQKAFTHVIHLAAWASVQPSIANPYIYTEVNIDGTVNMLEESRKHSIQSFTFASSSSVYGGQTKIPFQETDSITSPISPYAATKAAGELLCATWFNLYKMPITCLRFFTVYGPWGRPEMALFKFVEHISQDKPIEVRGFDTKRDFTYIDDIVSGIIAASDKAKAFSILNLGHEDAVPLSRFITAIETALGKKAQTTIVPLPKGDVPYTLADISKAKQEITYNPKTSIEEGITQFVDWYQSYYVPNFS